MKHVSRWEHLLSRLEGLDEGSCHVVPLRIKDNYVEVDPDWGGEQMVRVPFVQVAGENNRLALEALWILVLVPIFWALITWV